MSLGVYRDTLDDEVGYLVKSAKVKFAYAEDQEPVSYTHLTLPTTPYV